MTYRIIVLLAPIAALVSLIAYFYPSEVEEKLHPPVVVDVLEISKCSSYKKTKHYLGEIASSQVTALSFEISGEIESLFVSEGDYVQKGQEIALLDRKSLFARKKEINAEVKQALALYKFADLTKERVFQASESRAVSKLAQEEANQNLLSYEAYMNGLYAKLLQMDIQIDKARLTSPFSGYISKIMLRKGSVVNAGTPVVELVDLEHLEGRVDVSNSDIVALNEEKELLTKYGKAKGRITSIFPVRSSTTRSVEVICTLLSWPPQVRPGDPFTLNFTREIKAEGAWVPITSLIESGKGCWGLYVAEPLSGERQKYTLSIKEVEVIDQIEDQVYVVSQLNNGDFVVRDGLNRIMPGLHVVVKRETVQKRCEDEEPIL